MIDWTQLHTHYPLRALLAGWLYARYLKLHRCVRYALGCSGRRWRDVRVAVPEHVRVLE